MIHRSEAEAGDELLHSISEVINTHSWVLPEGKTYSTIELEDLFERKLVKLNEVYEQFKKCPGLINVTPVQLEEEYLQLIKFTNQHYKVEAFPPHQLLRQLFVTQKMQFNNIFRIFELCLCAPISNAKVERFFNYMKIIKTDWRNRLNEENLEALLRIKVGGPDLQGFVNSYCEDAVNLWWNQKQRRVDHKGKRKYKKRSTKITKRPRFSNEYLDEYLGTGSTSEDEDESI